MLQFLMWYSRVLEEGRYLKHSLFHHILLCKILIYEILLIFINITKLEVCFMEGYFVILFSNYIMAMMHSLSVWQHRITA